jgi:uncharacterized protein YycO
MEVDLNRNVIDALRQNLSKTIKLLNLLITEIVAPVLKVISNVDEKTLKMVDEATTTVNDIEETTRKMDQLIDNEKKEKIGSLKTQAQVKQINSSIT